MFALATSFNQNLCNTTFRSNWPVSVDVIFENSGCSDTRSPAGVNGPWCSGLCPHPFAPESPGGPPNYELITAVKEYLEQGCSSDLNCQARFDYGGAVSPFWCSPVVYRICISYKPVLRFRLGTGTCPVWQISLACLLIIQEEIPLLELKHSTNRSIGIQVCEAGKSNEHRCFHPPNQHTESEHCLGSATRMDRMFGQAHAFNQPLSHFDTSKVTDVSVFESTCWETRIWFPFPTQLVSDGRHVQQCACLQWSSAIWYLQGYECECIFVSCPTWRDTRFWSLTPAHPFRCTTRFTGL